MTPWQYVVALAQYGGIGLAITVAGAYLIGRTMPRERD